MRYTGRHLQAHTGSRQLRSAGSRPVIGIQRRRAALCLAFSKSEHPSWAVRSLCLRMLKVRYCFDAVKSLAVRQKPAYLRNTDGDYSG